MVHANRSCSRACRASHDQMIGGGTNVGTNQELTLERTAMDAARAYELLRRSRAYVRIAVDAGEL